MSHKKQCSFSAKNDEYKEFVPELKRDYFQRFETTGQQNPALFTADLVGILGALNRFHSHAFVVPGSHKCSQFFDALFKHQVTLFANVTSGIFRTDFIFDTLHEVNAILETLHMIADIDASKDSLQMATIRTIYKELGDEYVQSLPPAFQVLEIRLPKPSLVIFHPQLYVRYSAPTRESGFAGLRTVMRKRSDCLVVHRFRQRLQQWEGERLGIKTTDKPLWPMTIQVDPTKDNNPLARMEHTYHQSFDRDGYIVTSLAQELIQDHLLKDIDNYLKLLIGIPDLSLLRPDLYLYLPHDKTRRTSQLKSIHFHDSGFIGYGHFSEAFYHYVEKIKPFYDTLLRVLLEGEGTIQTTEIIFRLCRNTRGVKLL